METTDYSGMFVYKDGHIDYIQTSEGRLKWNNITHLYYAEYYIKDHLGNVRAVVTSDPGQSYAAQGTDYYPFGLEIPVYGGSDNQTKYNSKELQTEADLDWYDYGARFYDPVIGRFHVPDAYAEKYLDFSLYQYGANNPVCFIDVNGDSLMLFKNGTYVTTADNGSKEITGYNQESTVDENGNENFTGGQSFGFNDIETDQSIISDLRSGGISLNILSNADIEGLVNKSGANDQNVFSRWSFAIGESPAAGKLDFSTYSKIKTGTFNIINGMAYNIKDAGNYTWGFAMRKMGFTETTAHIGANLHAWYFGIQDNGPGSQNPDPFIRWFENKTWSGDSKSDLRAITNGMHDAGDYNTYKKRSIVNLFN
jgi:RHS repeat-associated protein